MSRVVINPDGTIAGVGDYGDSTPVLCFLGFVALMVVWWVLTDVVLPRWRLRRPARDNDWWPVLQQIERPDVHDPTYSFHARDARLVWYLVGYSRDGGHNRLGNRIAVLEGLWRTPTSRWFYMRTTVRYPRFWQGDDEFLLGDVYLELLTPRRAFGVLAAYPALLKQEFPGGRPTTA